MPNVNDNKLVNLADLKTAFDEIDNNKKDIQTVINDPTASGTAVSFIDSISQNTQGVISATKKTVQTASTTAAGLMSATDKEKLNGIAAGAQVNSITSVNNQTGAVSITPANIGAVAITGDTMTGALTVSGVEKGVRVTSPNNEIQFMIGESDSNRGIWDNTLNKWAFGYNNTGLILGFAVPDTQGGTGATSASAGANNLLSALPLWNATPTDDTYLIRKDTAGTDSFGQVKFSTIFTYIKNKFGTEDLTISGPLNVTNTESSGNGVRICEDNEGGNIRLYSQDGHYFEIDAYNNTEIRCRGVNDDTEANSVKFNRVTGVLSAPGGFDGNATTATAVKDAGNASKTITIRWSGSAASATDWIPMYDSNGNLVPVKLADLKTKLGIT